LNHLLGCKHLSNRYFAMRHGHSLANLQGLIVSHFENAGDEFGLSEKGRLQVLESVQRDTWLNSATVIVSSDFKRTRESAEIVRQFFKTPFSVRFDPRLRERNFGELELTADSGYAGIWREDEKNPDHQLSAVESANQVMARVTELVLCYESELSAATLLLVSHGDALQILQTAFCQQDAARHRQQQHLETAEIRQLVLT
jgi:broad specificity phosphatase PhoE